MQPPPYESLFGPRRFSPLRDRTYSRLSSACGGFLRTARATLAQKSRALASDNVGPHQQPAAAWARCRAPSLEPGVGRGLRIRPHPLGGLPSPGPLPGFLTHPFPARLSAPALLSAVPLIFSQSSSVALSDIALKDAPWKTTTRGHILLGEEAEFLDLRVHVHLFKGLG